MNIYKLCIDLKVCKILCDGDAFPVFIVICMHYVKLKNKGIVIQALGIISATLAVSRQDGRHSSISQVRFFI